MLLTLPHELRDLIYALALCPSNPNYRQKIHRSHPPRSPSPTHHLSLLRVSHQLYAEAHPIYYSANLFHISGRAVVTVIPFLTNISPRGLQHLRALSLVPSAETASTRHSFANTLATVPQLERLELRLDDNDTDFLSEVTNIAHPRRGMVAETLDQSRNYWWITALSGLKRFDIVLKLKCGKGEQGCVRPRGHTCAEWREAAREVESETRVEVYQPRAPWGQSARYLTRRAMKARVAQ
ncbi:uncharacterized protein BDZ99DRAFT_469189 [Mytilinidion resinicola]|uniref:F-box domain-containing protein n=1 Tax=Mytilinidion resinicola TaxID=574789 RepID=A0A6A6Y068_9PEZI|nr:uncharacterized protein BDZ99DRAFT_469189 [Mytilinidion resinicola]KAF2802162.1 hypothetical protein BDZ99DRAFT_469189 [Mytilinidion resinicola]